MTREEIRALLYEAAGSEVGIAVTTENPSLLRQRLYTVLRETLDLPPLSIHVSPTSPSNELWLVKKADDNEPPKTHA